MTAKHLRNIPLKLYRDFLKDQGCVSIGPQVDTNIGPELIY